MRARQPALRFIFLTLFLDILGIGLIIPILPKLVESFFSNNVPAAASLFGLLAAIYSLMQFICAPILGSLSDQVGRRPVILISLLGSGLDYLLLALAPSLAWFFVGRVIAGITSANISAATAYIADISPPEKRAANFGIVGAAFGLGFIAGPALGGMLGDHDLRLPFFVASALSLANWLYGFFVLPESLAPENRRRFTWGRSNPIGSLRALGRFPIVQGMSMCAFLLNLSQYSLHATWVLYTSHRYHWTTAQVGASLAVVGLMAAIVQGGLARRLIPLLGEVRSLTIGLMLGALSMFGYCFATQGWMIYVILVIGSLGGIAGPASQGIISRNVPSNEQGAVQGALAALGSVAGFIAPIMATSLFGFFIGDRAPVYLPGASFCVGGMLILVALATALRTLAKHPQRASSAV
ncbi:MAG: TCR/Tet family MFS transporter [Verrucomicrobiales bacterium]|nr:TCR/Tet family MFS transporter [Verrucomicrobiales bacterium]